MKNLKTPETIPHWQLFAHGSDMGIRGIGYTLSEAFEQASMAITAMVTDIEKINDIESVKVAVSAPEIELLFMDWINSVIYEMSTRKMLFRRYEVQLNNLTLEGTLWGEPVDVKRHQPAVEPKAATFTELKVTKLPENYWIAQCVVDI